MELRWVYVTTETAEEARSIGKLLVEKRLAACVNILEGMTSMYWWEGEVQNSTETVLIAKTQASRMAELTKAVREAHSYACPCIVSLPIVEGNPEFLEWIQAETQAATP